MLELANLLRERLIVIGDEALRKNDPEAHLAALQQVSEAILKRHQELRSGMPAQLNHFLIQCSFDKALAFLEQSKGT